MINLLVLDRHTVQLIRPRIGKYKLISFPKTKITKLCFGCCSEKNWHQAPSLQMTIEKIFISVNRTQHNDRFMRKLPKGAETANIMVGEVDDLETTLCGFMRLNDAHELGPISEVPLPTRFIIFLLGPVGTGVHLKEMGRCISTMMVDEVCRH